MKILPEMFKFICSSIEMHPRFLNFVFGLGWKTSSVDETFNGFYHRLSYGANGNSRPLSYGEF